MNNKTKKKILNQLGVSAMELVVAIAIFGGVSTIIFKNIEDQQSMVVRNSQDMAVESSLKAISDIFKKRQMCETILNSLPQSQLMSGDGMTITASDTVKPGEMENSEEVGINAINRMMNSAGANLDSGLKVEWVKMKMASPDTFEMKMNFARGGTINASGNRVGGVNIERSIVTNVTMVDGNINCVGYSGADIEDNSFRRICESIGGTVSGDQCNVDRIITSLRNRLKQAMCEALNKTSSSGLLLGSGKCATIDVANTIETNNIGINKLKINNQTRVKFDNSNCGSYLRGHTVAGEKSCSGIIAAFSRNPAGPITTPKVPTSPSVVGEAITPPVVVSNPTKPPGGGGAVSPPVTTPPVKPPCVEGSFTSKIGRSSCQPEDLRAYCPKFCEAEAIYICKNSKYEYKRCAQICVNTTQECP